MRTHAIATGAEFQQIQDVVTRHAAVRQAIVFGSVASERARRDRDLDIAVEGTRALSTAQKMALIAELGAATGRPIDFVDLKTVGEPLFGQILAKGKRLAGSNSAYARLVRRHLFDAEDFLPYVDEMLKRRRSRWIGPS